MAHRPKRELTVVCANTTTSYPCPRRGVPFTAIGEQRTHVLRGQRGYCSRACSDAGRRANQSAAQTARASNPAEQARRSAVMKTRWADPAVRQSLLDAARARGNDPAVRKRQSISAKARYANPAERERQSATQVARFKNSQVSAETRALLSAALTNAWVDPVKHERLGPRVGSGGVPAPCEALLLAALPAGSGWVLHHRVPGLRGAIDLALPAARIAVEIDGRNHRLAKQRAIDARKESFLVARDWTVLRFTNTQVRDDLGGCVAIIMMTSKKSKEA